MNGRELRDPADLQAVMGTPYQVSEQQWRAISAPLEPAVVIAGAGSGKTSVMAARVVYLVATGQVRADEVLGLTFTTKATAELGRRINESLEAAGFGPARGAAQTRVAGRAWDGADAEVLEPTVATYNAYAAVLLEEHGLRIGHEPDSRVLADAARYQLAARAIDGYRGRIELLTESPSHAINALLALDGAMSEHLVSAEDVRDFHRRQRPGFEAALNDRAKADPQKVLVKMAEREELLDLVAEYRALKRSFGLIDFSDQIALAARLALECPDVGRLERAKYRIVLLDEYQDTSVAQARMLAALFSGPDPVTGAGHPVTAVGDPNQAIYGWRGASVSNILNFGDFFGAPGVPVPRYQLTVNRRSDRRILEVANRLAEPLYSGRAQVSPLEPEEGAADGVVRTSVHETYAEELAWLVDQVRAAYTPGRGWREIGVLTRDNEHAADVFDALSAAEIPVEIVGLKGLIRLPEVTEVVATLSVLQDLTANADLLTLLSGPRWAIGPRDLALLGRRARELAGLVAAPRQGLELADELARAVAGADPTEMVSLADALDDPGEAAYSTGARERFGLLSAELRELRRHIGEPLLDLIRRIIDTTGLDVELASSVSPAARARRDNLDLFVKAVAEFQAVDGQVTLTALLAWLTAEDEMGTGLDVATPSEADSVKLLTVHRAKGLEWDSVFLVGVCEQKFPVTRGRSQWTTVSSVLPTDLRGDAADLPRLGGCSSKDIKALAVAARAHEDVEQLRLGYVAFTRARHLLCVSSYLWRDSRATPLGPSPYQEVVAESLRSWGQEPELWLTKPEDGVANPLHSERTVVPWPVPTHTQEAVRRIEAAGLVRRELQRGAGPEGEPQPDMVDAARIAEWDAEIEQLLTEARRERRTRTVVPLPPTLPATSVRRLVDDPEEFARALARPMPRPPSRAARFGTRFHAWVEQRFGQQQMLDPDELPGRADAGIEDDADLAAVVAAFEGGPFAERVPYALEAPFALVLGGQVVRGRIDAVYAEPDDSWLVVDWKTGSRAGVDPVQLALYRAAWAGLVGVPVERVRAAFHFVRTGETVEPAELPDLAALAELLAAEG